jgi:hypothetical protein
MITFLWVLWQSSVVEVEAAGFMYEPDLKSHPSFCAWYGVCLKR